MANNSSFLAKIVISARDEASAVFTSLQAKVAALAAAIASFFGIALFKASVDSARDLESAMSAVQAAAGATAEELEVLRAAAKEAGSSTQYSSVQAANALEELVKSGLSAADAVKALPAALDLATAGGVGLAEAAGYITQAVAGMSLSFEDSGRVADVLAQGANATKTSVEGLGQALSYAAPIANSLGLTLEETVGYLGKFADAGIDASRSGTALNAILAQFIDPASKFSEALRNSGIKTRDFNQAIRELAAAGPGAAEALVAVGTEAGPALRALLNQGIGSLDELVEKLENSGGSARTFAGIVSKNLDGALKGFSSAWTSLKEDIGTPVLDTLARQITAVADRLRAFVKDGTATAFGNTFQAAFEAAGKWASHFASKLDFAQLQADMRAFAEYMTATFTEIGNRATTASNVLNLAWQTMKTGMAAVQTAIYSLGAGMSWLASAFLSDLAKITDGLAKITLGDLSAGFKVAAERMRQEARATYAVYEEFSRKSGEAFAGISEGADKVNAAWVKVGDSATSAATDVEKAGEALRLTAAESAEIEKTLKVLSSTFSELGVSSQQVAAKLAEISAQTGVTVTSTRELGEAVREGKIAFDEATGTWRDGADSLEFFSGTGIEAAIAMQGFKLQLAASVADAKKLGDQTGDTAAKIALLTAQYKEFIAAGDTQGAAGVLVQINALKELAAQAGRTAEDLQKVETAFQTLGIKSQAELKRVADVAKEAFQTIRESGKAAPRDIEEAFKAYAVAAIEANGGVADSSLKSEAAMVGMRIEADATGKTIVRTMAESKQATEELAEATKDAASGMGTIGEAAEEAASGMTSLVDAARAQNAAVGGIQGSWMSASGAASQYAAEAREAVWSVQKSVEELRNGFTAYVSAMESLDRRQAAISSNGARGVEDLKLRLIELNGTEEEIAKARHERDKADIQRQMALLEIEVKRAARRGDATAQLKEEIDYLKEQLGLLDQIYKAEQRNTKNPNRTRGENGGGSVTKGGGSAGGSSSGGSAEPPIRSRPTEQVNHFHIGGVLDVNDPITIEKLARRLKPVTDDLSRRGFR